MTHSFNSACPCCLPRRGLSRRQFLCTTGGGSCARAPAIAATVIGATSDAQAAPNPKPGRPILLKGGTVLSLDRAIGDFEQADVLIEGKIIKAVQPNISAPNAQVIDAKNRIVMPGLIDTHRHMWQGFLRNVLPDGSLEDYRNVVQRTFGAKMVPDDVYAADLLSALGAIDCGVTCILDWSHIQNSPEHTDACIKGLQESGVRAVFAYGAGQNETGRVMEIATSKYPGDIGRLRKQYFSSDDQLVTLYLAALGRHARTDAVAVQGRARRRRPHHHPCRRRRVRPQRAAREAQRSQGPQGRHHLHPLLHAERHRVEADPGHRRHRLDRRLCRDADGPRQSAGAEGDRHRHPAES